MKNLKKIVFGLLAMLVMVTGVKAVDVAESNNIKYTSFDAALNAANDGDTITLLDDTTYSVQRAIDDKSITIDLQDHTLTMTAVFTIGSTKVGNLTIKNGTINADAMYNTKIFTVGEGSSFTMADVKITAPNLNNGALVQAAGTVKLDVDATLKMVKSGTVAAIVAIASPKANVELNGSYVASAIVNYDGTPSASRGNGATISLNGDFEVDYGIPVNNGLVVNIDGGSVIANGNVISFVDGGNGGIVNINAGTLTSLEASVVRDGSGYKNEINITSDEAKLISEESYALTLNNHHTKVAISGGYLESAGDLPAISIYNKESADDKGVLIPITDEDLAKVKTNLFGKLTGGHFLRAIVDDVYATTGSVVKAESAVKYMVKEGYVVTDEGDYKVISLAKAPSDEPATDEPSTDEPVVDPSNDGEPAGDETEGKVPSTFDGIASIVTMAISSVSAAGYSIKKIIRK